MELHRVITSGSDLITPLPEVSETKTPLVPSEPISGILIPNTDAVVTIASDDNTEWRPKKDWTTTAGKIIQYGLGALIALEMPAEAISVGIATYWITKGACLYTNFFNKEDGRKITHVLFTSVAYGFFMQTLVKSWSWSLVEDDTVATKALRYVNGLAGMASILLDKHCYLFNRK